MSAIFVQRVANFLIRKRTSSSSLILSTTLVLLDTSRSVWQAHRRQGQQLDLRLPLPIARQLHRAADT